MLNKCLLNNRRIHYYFEQFIQNSNTIIYSFSSGIKMLQMALVESDTVISKSEGMYSIKYLIFSQYDKKIPEFLKL